MAKQKKNTRADSSTAANVGYEAQLWQYGAPPAGNANFAWVQHIVHHLGPAGVAGFVLANGSMSSNQSGHRVALAQTHHED
ncbi:MAG: N-6 DNA methylase [Candidatus Rokubacteria bacterium]|nr:N-6 DNA methylase [Candidatus Rokubacteria bacterium]